MTLEEAMRFGRAMWSLAFYGSPVKMYLSTYFAAADEGRGETSVRGMLERTGLGGILRSEGRSR